MIFPEVSVLEFVIEIVVQVTETFDLVLRRYGRRRDPQQQLECDGLFRPLGFPPLAPTTPVVCSKASNFAHLGKEERCFGLRV
jgi:hypothetical protein